MEQWFWQNHFKDHGRPLIQRPLTPRNCLLLLCANMKSLLWSTFSPLTTRTLGRSGIILTLKSRRVTHSLSQKLNLAWRISKLNNRDGVLQPEFKFLNHWKWILFHLKLVKLGKKAFMRMTETMAEGWSKQHLCGGSEESSGSPSTRETVWRGLRKEPELRF